MRVTVFGIVTRVRYPRLQKAKSPMSVTPLSSSAVMMFWYGSQGVLIRLLASFAS